MDKQQVDFASYTLADFIDNPGFVQWVITPEPASTLFWESVQRDYPEKVPVIAAARELVLSLRFQQEHLPPVEQESLWNAIEIQAKLHQKPGLTIPLWLRSLAAILILGLLGTGLFFYMQQQKLMFSTAYGQVKTFTLPDGSVVTLNANTKLYYPKKWNAEQIREVWIEGEAFFKVNHLHQQGIVKNGERFIVHAEKLSIEVLGTTFNVNNRRGKIKVALLTGKVALQAQGVAQLKLQPGELAEYEEKQGNIHKKKIEASEYVSWKSNQLNFNNTPLTEVLQLIEDNYGYKTVMKDVSLGNKKLSGSFYFSSEDALFKAIAASLGIVIEKNTARHELIVK